VRPSERIAAAQQLPGLEASLRAELLAAELDPEAEAQVGLGRRLAAAAEMGELLDHHSCVWEHSPHLQTQHVLHPLLLPAP
jgi:hypothetical protein